MNNEKIRHAGANFKPASCDDAMSETVARLSLVCQVISNDPGAAYVTAQALEGHIVAISHAFNFLINAAKTAIALRDLPKRQGDLLADIGKHAQADAKALKVESLRKARLEGTRNQPQPVIDATPAQAPETAETPADGGL